MVSRDLHGITNRGNRGITAVKTAVMGNGFSILPAVAAVIWIAVWTLALITAVLPRNRGNGDNFSSITAVAAVMGTKHCVRAGMGMISCPHAAL